MMDCDTTGIEPDIALVKYKQLAGGGMLKIVNRTVPMALRKLGYDEPVIRGVLDYIDAHDTIEGAPGLKDDHLPVFDCAFAPPQGGRSIHFRGHLRMMAAVQPFLSGAISKTCNVPTRGHRRRDPGRVSGRLEAGAQGPGDLSRRFEGESAGEHQGRVKRRGRRPDAAASRSRNRRRPRTRQPCRPSARLARPTWCVPMSPPANQPRRERLPHTRRSLTHKFDIQGHEGYINVGFYPDGRPGELFITMAKEGSTIGGLMDVLGTAISIGLQYGVPLEVFVNKFAHSRFEPAGFTKNPDIPIAKSVADYIFRWLGMEFIPGYREANAPKRPSAETEAEPVPTRHAHAQGKRPPHRDHRRPRACRGRHGGRGRSAASRPPPPADPRASAWVTASNSKSASSPTSRATPPPAITAAHSRSGAAPATAASTAATAWAVRDRTSGDL